MAYKQINPDDMKRATVKELFENLSSTERGLSAPEAKERLQQYGYNEITEKNVSPIIKFLSYFWEPIPGMIEVPAILSAIIHHWEVRFYELLDHSDIRFSKP